jgi:hypothetical protein
MCNAAKHPSGCECGFGPPYPGKIELVETVEWVDEAASSKESFTSALKDLNISGPTYSSFVREYESIQHLHEPNEAVSDRLRSLVGRLEYREESSKYELVHVPLFRLHSPPVKKARVTYREAKVPEKERGWFVKIFGNGMAPTKTLHVIYKPDFVSERGQCLQIHVPLVLHIRSIGVYKSGVLQSRGIRAEVENIKEESTLRKRGCHTLDKNECANRTFLGSHETREYSLSKHSASQVAKFELSLPCNVARTVEMRFVEVFGKTFNALAKVKHERRLELEFELPGSRDYKLSFSPAGLQWGS